MLSPTSAGLMVPETTALLSKHSNAQQQIVQRQFPLGF